MLDGNSEQVSGIGRTGEGGTGEGGTGGPEVTVLLNSDTDSASILTGTALAHPGTGHLIIPVWP